jgi:hypothetical protein
VVAVGVAPLARHQAGDRNAVRDLNRKRRGRERKSSSSKDSHNFEWKKNNKKESLLSLELTLLIMCPECIPRGYILSNIITAHSRETDFSTPQNKAF